MIPNELAKEIERMVNDLAQRRYAELASDGRGGRLTEVELQQAIRQYGRVLVPLPQQAWELVELYPDSKDGNRFAIDVPLWTAEEGRSDLTLLLVATKHDNRWNVAIDDIRVL